MAKKTAAQAPNICPDGIVEALVSALYEQSVGEGLVPPIRGEARGRPRRDWRRAARVAATVAAVGMKKTGELLEKEFPGQPVARHKRGSSDPHQKRVRRYLALDAAHRADMLKPDAADQAYRSPEEGQARLDRLIRHYVGLAYEQWLRVEKTLDD